MPVMNWFHVFSIRVIRTRALVIAKYTTDTKYLLDSYALHETVHDLEY